MRLFFALWPPRETAEALAAWAAGLEGRKVPAEKIHLTLAFLGGAAPGRAIAAAKPVSAKAFLVPIDTAKYVRSNDMVWVGPRETPEALRLLAERLQLALYRAEFMLERRPFAAHVTLVRKARRPAAIAPLPEVRSGPRNLDSPISVVSARMDDGFVRLGEESGEETEKKSRIGVQGEGGAGGGAGRQDALRARRAIRCAPAPDHGVEKAAA